MEMAPVCTSLALRTLPSRSGRGRPINATTPYGGSGSFNVNPYSLVTTSASSFSNAGSINLNGTNGSGSGNYQATVFLNQGATSITATNSGTISSQLNSGNVTQALEIVSTTGNITATNSGTLTAGSSLTAYVLQAVSTVSGDIAITNTQSGSITAGVQGSDLYVVRTGAGTLSLNNAGLLTASIGLNGDAVYYQSQEGDITASNTGTITGSHEGINLTSFGAGDISVTNTGSISGAHEAMSAASTSGNVFLSNSGTVSSVYEAISAQTNTGTATVVNTGMVTGGTYAGIYFGGATASLVNSGTITNASGSAIYAEQEGGTGNIEVVNNGMITNSGSAIYVLQGGGGSIQVINNDMIATCTNGIVIQSNAGQPVTVTNSGSISVTDTGIELSTAGTVVDSGPITGGIAAMNLPSGSTVRLAGRPVITGTIIGGATSSSTSQLVFNLSIPSANLAAAQTQLNAEIATYGAQNGGNYTFTVDGLTFDISNFAYGNGDITDDLTLPPVARLYRNTPGFYSEGVVLDTLPSGNAVAARILAALNNVPDAGLVNALSELSPKELEVFRNVAFDNNTFNVADVNNHLANLRDGLTGFDASQLTVRDAGMDPTLDQVRDHLLAYNPASTPGLVSDSAEVLGAFDAKDMKSTAVNTTPPDRWSSFIAGKVILADLSDNPNLQDSNYTTGSVSAGLDYRLDDHVTIGALFAYAHTDASLDSRGGSATVDSYSPGIYASYVDGGWYGNFLGAYTRNAYTEDREINLTGPGGDNHGATSGNQGSANLTGGYEFQKGAFKFGPVASLQYVHLAIDSIQEQGPTALDIQAQDQDSLRTLLGVEARFNTNVGPVNLTPHASVSWQHEYLDNSRGITSAFDGAGGGSFSTQTDTPDRDSAFIDVGLDATVCKNVTVFVDYQAQAGQSNFFAQSAQGGVKIGF